MGLTNYTFSAIALFNTQSKNSHKDAQLGIMGEKKICLSQTS